MRGHRTVGFREQAPNRWEDEWSTISPDADTCSTKEDDAERKRRVEIYAEYVRKGLPIKFLEKK